jgi:hypothetical protein
MQTTMLAGGIDLSAAERHDAWSVAKRSNNFLCRTRQHLGSSDAPVSVLL